MTRPNKYKAKKVKTEDGTFDSQAEYRRWLDLKLLVRTGKITKLRRRTRWPIEIKGFKVCTYEDDASYYEMGANGSAVLIVEDVKGVRTPVYRLKKKLMKAIHGIEIQEVGA